MHMWFLIIPFPSLIPVILVHRGIHDQNTTCSCCRSSGSRNFGSSCNCGTTDNDTSTCS